MKLDRIELLIVLAFLTLNIMDFFPYMDILRVLGYNLLNRRFWSYLVVAVLFLTKSISLRSRVFVIMLAYIGIYLFLEYVGHYNLEMSRTGRFSWLLEHHLPLGVSMLLCLHYCRPHRQETLQLIVRYCLGIILLTCLISLIVINNNRYLVRGTDQIFYKSLSRDTANLGFASYGFFSSLPFVIPIFIYQIKQQIHSKRIITWASLFLVNVTSYIAVYVAPFLLLVIGELFLFFSSSRIKRNIVIIVVILAFFIIIPSSYVGERISSTSKHIPNKEISRKVDDIGLAFSEGVDLQVDENVTTIEGRAARYPLLISIFLDNILIGSGNKGNTHIFWLDILAMYGIIGFLPLLLLLSTFVRVMVKKICPPLRVYVISSILLFIALGLMKAISGSLMYLVPFFIVPAYFYNESLKSTAKKDVR